eukprot:scaffold80071_cov54-Phaeocystis_antarctica.AAC.1
MALLSMALLTMALLTMAPPPRTCRKRRRSLRTVHHGLSIALFSIALLTMASLQVALQDRVQLTKGAHLHSKYSHSKYSHSKYGHSKYGNRRTTVLVKGADLAVGRVSPPSPPSSLQVGARALHTRLAERAVAAIPG